MGKKIDLNPTKNHIKKTHKRLKKLSKRGKLKRHVRDGINSIAVRKTKDIIKGRQNIEEDWVKDREALYEEENINDMTLVPIDMLNADVDWENTPFKNERKRLMKKLRMEEEQTRINDDVPRKFRNVEETKKDSKSLPVKIDGKIVFKEEVVEEEDVDIKKEIEDEEVVLNNDVEIKVDLSNDKKDYSKLSASELLGLRHIELEKLKEHISCASLSVISNPEQNVDKLKDLLRHAIGNKVNHLVVEDSQKIATASLAEIFIDIIPGYYIRDYSEAEMEQKMKQETKALFNFEKTLLEVYKQYLTHLESFIRPLTSKNFFNKNSKATFRYKMGIIANKCLCKLIRRTTHFNYAANIIKLIVRFGAYCIDDVSEDCCKALSDIMKEDYQFRTSLCAAREIASAVRDKKCNVPPRLLGSLLSLNIKEVDKKTEDDDKKEKKQFKARKNAIHKDRKSKSVSKYEKQLKKLEKDLKEAEAANTLTEKMKFGTDTMKQVFTIYFSVIKRLSKSSLMEPVLEGLAKFAHLINIEFFDDLIASLSELVQDDELRVLDAFHCIYTVFVILSGEGKSINIDPVIFYKVMYKKISYIPFYNGELKEKCIDISIRCLHIMLNVRRKFVPTVRVAAYIKRIVAISFLMDSKSILAILALVRTLFISHRTLTTLVECDEDDEGGDGLFIPEMGDPDCTQAMSSSLIPDMKKLIGHPCKEVGIFAVHILAGCPSTGTNRLAMIYVNKNPTDFLTDEDIKEVPSPYKEGITKVVKKAGVKLSWKNVQTFVEKWLSS
uniref:NOC3-like protein n=1 Tax=Parastrongyloides trichosuri TaxID=131310 RepID=A0A0N5A011_PARTI